MRTADLHFRFLTVIFMLVLLSPGVCLSLSAHATIPEVPDENGVIMYNYNGIRRQVYNPLFVAIGGLKYYSEYEDDGDQQSRQYFLNTADWLVNNAKEQGPNNYTLWEYRFPWSSYGWISPHYASGLAQAQGLMVLILAHNLTGEIPY